MYHESTELFLFHVSSGLDHPAAVCVRASISTEFSSKYDMNFAQLVHKGALLCKTYYATTTPRGSWMLPSLSSFYIHVTLSTNNFSFFSKVPRRHCNDSHPAVTSNKHQSSNHNRSNILLITIPTHHHRKKNVQHNII